MGFETAVVASSASVPLPAKLLLSGGKQEKLTGAAVESGKRILNCTGRYNHDSFLIITNLDSPAAAVAVGEMHQTLTPARPTPSRGSA